MRFFNRAYKGINKHSGLLGKVNSLLNSPNETKAQ